MMLMLSETKNQTERQTDEKDQQSKKNGYIKNAHFQSLKVVFLFTIIHRCRHHHHHIMR